MAIPGGVKRGKPRGSGPPKKRIVVVVPKREVAVQAPKPKARRGHAPTVFEQSPIRNPIEKIQTKQARQTARAVQNMAHAQRGNAEVVVPKAPKRPLTNREAAQILNSPQGHTVIATVPTQKKGKKKHFGVGPVPLGAILADVPAELKGAGAIEAAITRIGATSAKGWEQVPGVGHFLGNVVKDTSGVVAGAVPSVYIPASQVATGHPGKALKTVYGGIKETVKHPVEHPVSLALIVRGGEGAVSRGAGEISRHSPSKAIRDYGSTERAPIALGGSALHTRRASKGLVENRVQKAADRRALKKGRGTVVKVAVRDGEGNLQYTAKVPAIKASKRQLEKPHVVGGKLNRRVDTEAGKANTRLRDMRTAAVTALDRHKPKHGAEDAAALVNEGVLKHPKNVEHDLREHLTQLQEERANLDSPADLADNAALIAQTERLLSNKKFLADPHSAFKAARVYAETHRPLEEVRGRHGDLTKNQIEGRPLLTFAVREMGLHFDQETHRFLTPDGQPVTNQRIVNAFVAKGGDPKNLAYLPTKADFSGASNFYGSSMRRPGAETKRFTGTSARAGTYERGWEVMRQQLSNAAVKVARHQSVSSLVDTFGLKQTNGKFFDYEQAIKEARDQKHADGREYVPVTAARKTAPDALVDDLTPEELQQTFREAEPGDAHVVLFPKQVWDRLKEQEGVRGRNAGMQTVQSVSQAFRHTVLSTSTKWLFGNSLESYLRMQINELTPVQIARTIKAGKKFEQDLAKQGKLGKQRSDELRATAGPGMFLGQKNLDLYQPDAAVASFARKIRQSGFGPGKKIGPKGIVDLWDSYRNAVTTFNGVMAETSIYHYALGKEVRQEVQQLTGLWDRAMSKAGPAYEAVVQGALDSNKIAQYADAVDLVRGRYANLSPTGRYFVNTYTPFAPWYVNSLHFFAITLPVHHPVKTGILAAVSRGTAEERDKLNLPPWAQGVPMGDGRVLPVQHFLPTGITESGTEGVTSLVLPQISSIGLNLAGQSWNRRDFPEGTSNVAMALNTAAGTFLPFYSKVQTVLEKGGKPETNSTLFSPKVKEGTKKNIKAGVIKAVAPIRAQQTTPTAESSGGWGSAAGSSSGSNDGWGAAAR